MIIEDLELKKAWKNIRMGKNRDYCTFYKFLESHVIIEAKMITLSNREKTLNTF